MNVFKLRKTSNFAWFQKKKKSNKRVFPFNDDQNFFPHSIKNIYPFLLAPFRFDFLSCVVQNLNQKLICHFPFLFLFLLPQPILLFSSYLYLDGHQMALVHIFKHFLHGIVGLFSKLFKTKHSIQASQNTRDPLPHFQENLFICLPSSLRPVFLGGR
jgi:hypothetical protein